jgi:hypothetical protein
MSPAEALSRVRDNIDNRLTDAIEASASPRKPSVAAPLADDQGSPFENGSATPATTVALPADPTLSGVLWGTRWNTGFITYSDPDSTADYLY